MLPVENNFNKYGLPHVYITLFRCRWVPAGGLDPFRRRSSGLLPLKKNTLKRLGLSCNPLAVSGPLGL